MNDQAPNPPRMKNRWLAEQESIQALRAKLKADNFLYEGKHPLSDGSAIITIPFSKGSDPAQPPKPDSPAT